MMTSEHDRASAPGKRRGTYANGQQRRQEFIMGALELFASHGFQRLSLRKIAEALGVSHAALTYHFPSKEDLLEAVFEAQEQRERPLVEQRLAEKGMLDALPELLQRNNDIPDIIQLDVTILAEAIRADHSAHEWAQRRMDRTVDALREGLAVERENGRLRPDLDLDITAHQIGAMVRGLQLQWLYHRDFPLEAHLSAFMNLLRP
ncbi:helix-turn-helix domain-containing protein [uncultured Microbacterium sp.]|uniref:TetR/AcrR family transcriptional regulator n=1 Tax=uncultured Microbacterium sp. TaxID=191216 RepID=UPI0028E30B60|nr:helix-turn-helix domain-containing protein [uncultured Microbacterium sp.]